MLRKGKDSLTLKVLFPTYTTFLTLTILMKMLQHILTFFINYSFQKKFQMGRVKAPILINVFLKDGNSSSHPTLNYNASFDTILITEVVFVFLLNFK